MGIYLGSTELGGGGGAAIGDYALKPAANGANVYTDSNGHIWLKTGVGETNLDLYPLLPKISLPDTESQNGERSHLGSIWNFGSRHKGSMFMYDSFNDYTFLIGANQWKMDHLRNVTFDSDGKIQNPFPTIGTTAGQLWGTSTPTDYRNVEGHVLNNYATLSSTDGTDHWVLASQNTSPTSANGFPHRNNFTTLPSTGGELNMWRLRKVIASTTTDLNSLGNYTYDDSAEITPSGVPNNIDVTDGSYSSSSYTNRIGIQFAVTDTQILINVKPLHSSYHHYYYYFGYAAPWQVHAFNKSTGAWEGLLYENSFVFNDDSGTGYCLVENTSVINTATNASHWDIGLKTVVKYDTNHTRLAEATLPLVPVFNYTGFNVNMSTDSQGRIVQYDMSLLSSAQLENATGAGSNNDNDDDGATVAYIEEARGVASKYARGLTKDTAGTATGSNSGTDTGPLQTNESIGEQLYIRAL